MRQRFVSLLDRMESVSLRVATVMLAAAVSAAFGEVISRYVFGKSHAYIQEWTVYLWIFGAFLLAGVLERHDEHINFTLLLSKLHEKHRRRMEQAIVVTVLLYAILFAWVGMAHTSMVRAADIQSVSELWYPVWPTRLILPVSAVLLFVFTLERLLSMVAGSRRTTTVQSVNDEAAPGAGSREVP